MSPQNHWFNTRFTMTLITQTYHDSDSLERRSSQNAMHKAKQDTQNVHRNRNNLFYKDLPFRYKSC